LVYAIVNGEKSLKKQVLDELSNLFLTELQSDVKTAIANQCVDLDETEVADIEKRCKEWTRECDVFERE
jgi:hypothetical protein